MGLFIRFCRLAAMFFLFVFLFVFMFVIDLALSNRQHRTRMNETDEIKWNSRAVYSLGRQQSSSKLVFINGLGWAVAQTCGHAQCCQQDFCLQIASFLFCWFNSVFSDDLFTKSTGHLFRGAKKFGEKYFSLFTCNYDSTCDNEAQQIIIEEK